MNKKMKNIIIGATIIIIIFIIFLPKLISSGDENVLPQNPGMMNRSIPVTAHVVEFEKLSNKVYTTGTILSNEEVELRSEIAGKITSKINDADLQAQLRKAESKVKLVEDREVRQNQLVQNQMISQEDYESTLNDLAASKAEYDLIKAEIDKTEIKAPFSGYIGLREVSEGSFVTTTTVIARLQNLSNLKVDFAIPQKYASLVKIGDEVSFKLSTGDSKYKARVYAIEPKIDPSTRTLKLRAICQTNYKDLFPGAFVNVEVKLKENENAILIPTVAIVPELKGQSVYLYRGGTVMPQAVELGLREEKRVQIVSGLEQGDTVITSGILQIRPGAKVQVTEFN
jgi:membrane fusion protein (multidrug efflux system)